MAIDMGYNKIRVGNEIWEYVDQPSGAVTLNKITPEDIKRRLMTVPPYSSMSVEEFIQQVPQSYATIQEAYQANAGRFGKGLTISNQPSPEYDRMIAQERSRAASTPGQTPTSGGTTQPGANLGATGASTTTSGAISTTNIPAYKDSSGRVYDASGGYISWEAIPKGPDGNPVANLDLLPVRDVPAGAIPSQQDIVNNLKTIGISDETIASMDSQTQTMFAAFGEMLKKQMELNNPLPQNFTPEELNQIFAKAQADPTINEYYKNQLRLGQEVLGRSLSYLGAGYTAEQAATALKQEKERQQLAETEAEAGRVFSGFRQKAREELGQQQTAVIESSKRTLQRQLEQLGSQFEQQYGSTNLPQINIGQVGYTPIGSVPGQLEQQKLADIRSLAQQETTKAALTRGLIQ